MYLQCYLDMCFSLTLCLGRCLNFSGQKKKSFVQFKYMRNPGLLFPLMCVRLLLFACGSAQRDLPAILPVIQHTQPGMLHTGEGLIQTMKPVGKKWAFT